MTNTTATQTAILVILKGGQPKSTQRFATTNEAIEAREMIKPFLPGHTFGLIADGSDKETCNAWGVTFEVESANGKVKHNIPSYALARSYARRYANEENAVEIRQLAPVEVEEDDAE